MLDSGGGWVKYSQIADPPKGTEDDFSSLQNRLAQSRTGVVIRAARMRKAVVGWSNWSSEAELLGAKLEKDLSPSQVLSLLKDTNLEALWLHLGVSGDLGTQMTASQLKEFRGRMTATFDLTASDIGSVVDDKTENRVELRTTHNSYYGEIGLINRDLASLRAERIHLVAARQETLDAVGVAASHLRRLANIADREAPEISGDDFYFYYSLRERASLTKNVTVKLQAISDAASNLLATGVGNEQALSLIHI